MIIISAATVVVSIANVRIARNVQNVELLNATILAIRQQKLSLYSEFADLISTITCSRNYLSNNDQTIKIIRIFEQILLIVENPDNIFFELKKYLQQYFDVMGKSSPYYAHSKEPPTHILNELRSLHKNIIEVTPKILEYLHNDLSNLISVSTKKNKNCRCIIRHSSNAV